MTERDSPVPKRTLNKASHKTSTKNTRKTGPYTGSPHSPATNVQDSHFTIKVVDGNKNISGGEVNLIQTQRAG